MTPEGRIFIQLKDALDNDITSFSERLPGDIKDLKKLADANYASYKGTYANPTMATLGRVAKDNPEDVYRMLIKPGDVNDIRRLKSVVGEEGFVPLRRKFVDDLITGPDGKMLSGPQITRNMSKTGFETMREILTPSQLSEIVKAADKREMPQFVESEIEKKLGGLIQAGGGVSRVPEEIVKRVMDGDSVTIKALKKVVGEKGMKPYKRAIVEQVIGSPEAEGAIGAASPTSLKMTSRLASYGESLQHLFTPEELFDFTKIQDIRTMLEMQGKLSSNYAGTASSLVTGGAMAELLLNPTKAGAFVLHNPISAVATVLTPDILSRFYVSKMGRQLLIDGMSEGAAKNTVLASRIAAFAANAIRANAHEREQSIGTQGMSLTPGDDIPPPPPPPELTAPPVSNLSPEAAAILK
jgi:hypothetical protein